MPLDKLFYLNTGKDGILGDTSAAEVRAIAEAVVQADRAVLHFHGGLVNKQKALAKAEVLLPVYQAAGAHPVFFIWEAGLLEVLRHNLDEIAKERIFDTLVGRILQQVVGKLRDAGPAKSVTGAFQLPTDIEVKTELAKRQAGLEPFAGQQAPQDLEDLTPAQQARFEAELAKDQAFREEVEAIANAVHPEKRTTDSKGVATAVQRSAKTLMSPEVVEEVAADRTEAAAKGAKGVLATARLVARAGKVLMRVVQRLRRGRDHGAYVTVVEEVLREFYVANVGAEIWHRMKKETSDTFDNAGNEPKRGGWLFVEELGRAIGKLGRRPQITLVGHSTGAVFICHLLRHVEAARRSASHPLPKDFTFKNVALLAPAVSCALFADSLEHHRHLFESFRMFSMTDANETGNALVPVVYPRSLLYFVSGVVEREADDSGAFDLPILGMERYVKGEKVYAMPEVVRVRQFLAEDPRHTVWAVADGGPGRQSNALGHSAFDDLTDEAGKPLTTLASLQHLIRHGA
jgi:hypothetical protein